MFEIKVTIDAPELSDAINKLANAYIIGAKETAAVFARPALTVADNTVNSVAEPKTIEIPKIEMPAETESTEAEATPPAAITPEATDEREYTLDEISRAGAALIDQGKMPQLIDLLKRYGVQAITQLKPEQYIPVAVELRGLGAEL